MQELFKVTADQVSPRNLDMLSGECCNHILRGNSKARHFCQIDVHAYLALTTAADKYLAHTIDVLQQLFDLLAGYPVQLVQGAITLEHQPHHRNGIRIDLRHNGCFCLIRQIVDHLVDFGLHLVEGHVRVFAEFERYPYL